MTMTRREAEALLARSIFNSDDRTDLVNAARDNDAETIAAIDDRPDVIAAARIIAAD